MVLTVSGVSCFLSIKCMNVSTDNLSDVFWLNSVVDTRVRLSSLHLLYEI
jgi:hypothetical protein